VGVFSVATYILAFWQRPKRPLVFWMAFFSLVVVVVNAVMGALVVSSNLQSAIITTHLALAMLLIGTLTYCAWRGTDQPWRATISPTAANPLRLAIALLLCVIVAEGIMGSQIRELTDEMAKSHLDSPRAEWIGELENRWIYLIHRSFSWAVLAASVWAFVIAKRHGRPGRVGSIVLGIVIAQMLLGVVMSQIHLYAWVQVLHVGLAAVLLSFTWLWLFGCHRVATRV
jgi:cytochrome c oxidase assembly protein subunit 15